MEVSEFMSLTEYADRIIVMHEEYFVSNNYLGKFAKEIIHQSPSVTYMQAS